jgi:hypothetical protein
MVDCSRNGVLRPEYLMRTIPALALLGLNYLTLYTEDTYEVRNHPLIGYKRGKYTQTELKELAAYAELFGITMFPCIQTLGHLEQILRIPAYNNLQDDFSILSVKKPETYRLIEDLLKNAVAPYKTNLVHIGMDETWGLGKGRCFEVNRKIDPRQMYLEHLLKVNAICKKLKLQPIMWGDIVIGMHGHLIKGMDQSQTRRLPKNMVMDFWNYYQTDPQFYKKTIQQYRAMGFEPLISPGLWNWNHPWADFDHAQRTMLPFLTTARSMGVDRVLMTMWGDDGQEAPFSSNAPGLCSYLETAYHGGVEMPKLARLTRQVFQDDFASFVLPGRMNMGPIGNNLAKGLLFDDPLLGIYSIHAGSRKFAPYFARHTRQLRKIAGTCAPANRRLFTYALAMAEALELKADLRNTCVAAYRRHDRAALKRSLRAIAQLVGKMNALRTAHRAVWEEQFKMQGWEALDVRYGGQLARLETMGERIDRFVKGKLTRLDEFEEKDLKLYKKMNHYHVSYGRVAQVSTVSRW